MSTPDTSPAFFESMFQKSADPWNFAGDPYEQFRYSTVLRALGAEPYRHGFEPGCSVGVLTERLAGICDRVDAFDISASAVAAAQERCRALRGVTVQLGSLRDSRQYEGYDLIVLSEIGYYFKADEWRCLLAGIVESVEPGTVLLASHWLGHSPDHVRTGDEVHEGMMMSGLQHEAGERHPDATRGGFRLDRWRKLA